MNVKNILDHTLLETERISIRVFDIFEVIFIIIITSLLVWILRKLLKRQPKKPGLKSAHHMPFFRFFDIPYG